ncbi:hypothetical protein K440DRAFT_615843 [Wilcoxina mikolae CBS 423.85]|nr:hypothetical protein K440DRAFT_615843 [Wilcoxina mikolae CBS 423.85]
MHYASPPSRQRGLCPPTSSWGHKKTAAHAPALLWSYVAAIMMWIILSMYQLIGVCRSMNDEQGA